MRTLHDIAVIETMQALGGSFVKALAEACIRADDANLTRIKSAFPEIWQDYAEMYEIAKRRAERATTPTGRTEREG